MKRAFAGLLVAVIATIVFFSACGGKFVVEFYADGSKYSTVRTDGEIQFPSPPTKTGYRFDSWKDEQAQPFTETTTDKSLKLYATFIPNTYTVAYDKNASMASGSMSPSEHVYDVAKALSTCTLTYAGHTLIGWSRTAIGSIAYAPDETVINLTAVDGATVTLYALWEAIG